MVWKLSGRDEKAVHVLPIHRRTVSGRSSGALFSSARMNIACVDSSRVLPLYCNRNEIHSQSRFLPSQKVDPKLVLGWELGAHCFHGALFVRNVFRRGRSSQTNRVWHFFAITVLVVLQCQTTKVDKKFEFFKKLYFHS
jgi:hypothetical protein